MPRSIKVGRQKLEEVCGLQKGGEGVDCKPVGRRVVTAAPSIDRFHVLLPRRTERAVPESNVIGALSM